MVQKRKSNTPVSAKRPARIVMIQGTGSSVGKSFLVTGLCRLFAQDGYRVAPFKAQNMSLNSGVTPDGLEIGRAQVVQAEAAGVEPTVEMNPVLLKPEGDMTSQLVAMGKMAGHVQAYEFLKRREHLWAIITPALDTLRSLYDVVVVEGAGSPAEINLRDGDIVNMEVALYARAPVLIAGDIDKGGVFASLYGTHALIDDRERSLVRGFIINKFRGDVDVLTPGLDMIEDLTGVPVVGVLPYLTDVYVPEEDSPRQARTSSRSTETAQLDVAVIALPHMANFDEFDPLARRQGVRLRYVREVADFGSPDLLILPGSKTTVSDLDFVRDSGLEDRIRDHAALDRPVIGICGGLQMLGSTIYDPHAVESDQPAVDGMGLLDVDTHFAREKMTTRAHGKIGDAAGLLRGAAGMPFAGYEIHVGVSNSRGSAVPVMLPDSGADPVGFTDRSGRILGTYIHDLFKNEQLVDKLLSNVSSIRGKDQEHRSEEFSQDAEYDKLASYLRKHLDIGMVYRIMGLD